MCMGYSNKFLEAFITDPSTFPNPTVVGPEQIREDETRAPWKHPLHTFGRPAPFLVPGPFARRAVPRLSGGRLGPMASPMPVHVRDLDIEAPSGHLVTGHTTSSPRTHAAAPSFPKSCRGRRRRPRWGEVVVYRIIRGTAGFADGSGTPRTLGDTVTAGASAHPARRNREDTRVLRLGLLKGMEDLGMWTPNQRDEIDALAGKIITRSDLLATGWREGRSATFTSD